VAEVHLLHLKWTQARWRRVKQCLEVDSLEGIALVLVGHPPLFAQLGAKTHLAALIMFDFKSALNP
jgi:hypothetical protein